MKKIFFLFCCLGLLLGGKAFAQDSNTKIKIKVKDSDGKLIEKEYDSEEAMRNDPELEELGITVNEGPGRVIIRSNGKGDGQQIMVFKRKGGGEDDFSYEYRTGDTDHFFSDTAAHKFRQRFYADSMRFGDTFVELQEQRQELDSLLKEKRVFVMAMSDSLREMHFEDMEKHREEMRLHMEEMREHMKEMRERTKVESSDGSNRVIIIQSLSKEEAEELEVKDQSLQLDGFKLYPNPGEGNIKIEFEANENGPVQIKLMDATGKRVLYDETRDLSGGFFQDTIEVGQHDSGIYILQIIQNNKALSRRVIMR